MSSDIQKWSLVPFRFVIGLFFFVKSPMTFPPVAIMIMNFFKKNSSPPTHYELSLPSVALLLAISIYFGTLLANLFNHTVVQTVYFAINILAWSLTIRFMWIVSRLLSEISSARDANVDICIPTPIGPIRYHRKLRTSPKLFRIPPASPVLLHHQAGNVSESDFDAFWRITKVYDVYASIANYFGYKPVHNASNLSTILLHSFVALYAKLKEAKGLRSIVIILFDFVLSLTRYVVNKDGNVPERELYKVLGDVAWDEFKKHYQVDRFKDCHKLEEWLLRFEVYTRRQQRDNMSHQSGDLDPDDIPSLWEYLMSLKNSQATAAAKELLQHLNVSFIRYACTLFGVDSEKTEYLCEKMVEANLPQHAKFLDQFMSIIDVVFRLIKEAETNGISSIFTARPGVVKLYRDIAAVRERLDKLIASKDVSSYIDELGDLNAEISRLLSVIPSLMDTRNSISLLGLQKQLVDMRSSLNAKYASCQIRRAPFGILIHGPSSVLKSFLKDIFNEILLRRSGVLKKGEDPADLTSVIQSTDKYHSTVTNATQTIVLDDVANKIEDKEYTDATNIITFLNNVAVQAVKAEVNEKGTVFPQPKLAIATTNVRNLNAPFISNCPVSLLRRFNVCMDVTLKKPYRAKPEQTNSIVNKSSLRGIEDPLLNIWDFHFYEWHAKDDSREIITKTLKRTSEISDAIQFITEEFDQHQVQQESYLKSTRALREICGCGKFSDNCEECAMRHQFGFSKFVKPSWVQRVEDKIPIFSLFDTSRLFYNFLIKIPVRFHVTYDRLGDYIESCAPVRFYKEFIGDVNGLITHIKLLIMLIYMWVIYTTIYILSYDTLTTGIVATMFVSTFIYLNIYILLSFMQLRNKPQEVLERYRQPLKYYKYIAGVVVVYGAWKIVFKLWTLYRSQYKHEIANVHPNSFNMWKLFQGPQPVIGGKVLSNWAQPNYQSKGVDNFPFFEVQGVRKDTGKRVRVNIAPLGGNIFFINTHFLDVIDLDQPIDIKWDPSIGPTSQLVHHMCYRGDVSFVSLTSIRFPIVRDNLPVRMPIKGIANMSDHSSNFKYERTMEEHGLGELGPDILYTLLKSTADGMCGTPIVSQDLIVGFHNVGNGKRGGAVCVTQSDYDNAVRYFTPTVTYGTSEPKLSFLNKSATLSNTSEAKDIGKVSYLGDIDTPWTRASTSVTPSILSKDVQDVFNTTPKHEAPMHIKRRPEIPRAIAMRELESSEKLESKYLGMAAHDYMQHVDDFCEKYTQKYPKFSKLALAKMLRPLEQEEVFAGIDGISFIDAINTSTSMGFPVCRPKSEYMYRDSDQNLVIHPEIIKEIDETQERLDRGEQIQFVFRASFKDEPVKIGKEKVRVFAAGPLELLYFVRKYFLSITKLMQDHPLNFECAVGINANGPEWNMLYEYVSRFGSDRMVAGDYKAFDKGVSTATLSCAFEILIAIAKKYGSYSSKDIRIMEVLAQSCTTPVYEWFGSLIRVKGSNPSGNPLTVIINNLVNSLYQRAAYFALASDYPEIRLNPPAYTSMVSAINYGDDNLMSVNKDCYWFDHTKLQNKLAEWDVVYTMADKTSESRPFISIEECDFLKRGFRYDETNGRMMAPLGEDSILRSLMLRTKISITELEHAHSVIDGAQMQYYQYGIDAFKEKTQLLVEVASRSDIPWTPRTYEELQEMTEGNYRDLNQIPI